jgi:hypothetical protein
MSEVVINADGMMTLRRETDFSTGKPDWSSGRRATLNNGRTMCENIRAQCS